MSGIAIIEEPWSVEVEILGLSDEEVIVPLDSVRSFVAITEAGDTRIVINVQKIQVLGVSEDNTSFKYRVSDTRVLGQKWDTGGAYLMPEDMAIGM